VSLISNMDPGIVGNEALMFSPITGERSESDSPIPDIRPTLNSSRGFSVGSSPPPPLHPGKAHYETDRGTVSYFLGGPPTRVERGENVSRHVRSSPRGWDVTAYIHVYVYGLVVFIPVWDDL